MKRLLLLTGLLVVFGIPARAIAQDDGGREALRQRLTELRDKLREEGVSPEDIRATLQAEIRKYRENHATDEGDARPDRPHRADRPRRDHRGGEGKGPGDRRARGEEMKKRLAALREKLQEQGLSKEEIKERMAKARERVARAFRDRRGGEGKGGDRRARVEEMIKKRLGAMREKMQEEGMSDEEIKERLQKARHRMLGEAKKRAHGGRDGDRRGSMRRRMAEMAKRMREKGMSDEEIKEHFAKMRKRMGDRGQGRGRGAGRGRGKRGPFGDPERMRKLRELAKKMRDEGVPDEKIRERIREMMRRDRPDRPRHGGPPDKDGSRENDSKD